ncbi:MAG: hypothetical protein JRN11_05940 [Nitrososphaerota archaeon]|nr:hypothetical protein [Nitrososphaerota archaeon]MDG7013190.1 hypothetical protein [Nitrososphaerota archaeon]MDG7026271.1 hypothetical protein [Nitrososphaerota archaeon]
MDWIDRTVFDDLSKLHQEEALANPWSRQTARLAVLYGLTQSHRQSKKKLGEAKHALQRELDEYIANGSLGPRRPTWDPDGRESIPYHYSRLLALTLAIEFASGDSSTEVAKAIREEASGLRESYFRWCDHILGVWGGSIHLAGS